MDPCAYFKLSMHAARHCRRNSNQSAEWRTWKKECFSRKRSWPLRCGECHPSSRTVVPAGRLRCCCCRTWCSGCSCMAARHSRSTPSTDPRNLVYQASILLVPPRFIFSITKKIVKMMLICVCHDKSRQVFRTVSSGVGDKLVFYGV